MKLRCGYETKKARVEMLPLIDVVFLLLVFFIYAMLSMVVHHGLKISLPPASTAVLDKNDCITIMIDDENRIYLNNSPIALEDVPEGILQIRNKESKPVFINGDQTADLGMAIRLLDTLKKSGIEEVSFSCKTPAP